MKNLINYVLFFYCFFTFAQSNNNGIITYKKELLSNISNSNKGKDFLKKNPKLVSQIKNLEKKGNEILRVLEFELFMNEKESLFKVKKSLELQYDPSYGFAIGPYGSGIYYNNLSENQYYTQLEVYGEQFIIKKPIPKWKTYNKSKKIGNYICFKATTITEVKGRNGVIKYPITSWYCPELSFSFGPLGYCDLPGLILELEINNEKYTATKIEINKKKEIKVKKPTKGKIVTKEEFEEIGLKTMNEFKKSIGK